jgi:hypothetical protein
MTTKFAVTKHSLTLNLDGKVADDIQEVQQENLPNADVAEDIAKLYRANDPDGVYSVKSYSL